jgi:hypothetical protein
VGLDLFFDLRNFLRNSLGRKLSELNKLVLNFMVVALFLSCFKMKKRNFS